jgi:hypothetical protein
MILADLKNAFPLVQKVKEGYLLHGEGGKRTPYKYLATVKKKRDKFCVDGFPFTKDIGVLIEQIKEYHKTLPFDSEYYNPLYRKGVLEDLVVYDYLDSIGFRHEGDFVYMYKPKSIYGIPVTNIGIILTGMDYFNEVKDEVEIKLFTEGQGYTSVVTKAKRDAVEIIKGIESLLKPLLTTESLSHLELAEPMEMSDIDIALRKIEGLDIKEFDIKKHIKKRLLEIASKL